MMTKRKTKKREFDFLQSPAKLLAMPRISAIEKFIISDVGYFNGNGYRGYTVSNADMAKKFGVSRRTIINALQRLRSYEMIKDIGVDEYHRCLKLNGAISSLFEDGKGERIALPDKTKSFQKPTPREVAEYAASIGFGEIDAKHFCEYYEAANWKIKGGKAMRNWKQAVVTWKKTERRNNGSSKNIGSNQPAEPYIR